MCIDLPVPLPAPTPPAQTPPPETLISTGTPLRKLPPVKTTPWFLPECYVMILWMTAVLICNLCSHLQRWQMPDIENCRKTAEKGAERVPGQSVSETAEKQPEKQPKQSKQLFSGVSAVLPAVSRLFHQHPHGTFFGCFPAAFNVGHLSPL